MLKSAETSGSSSSIAWVRTCDCVTGADEVAMCDQRQNWLWTVFHGSYRLAAPVMLLNGIPTITRRSAARGRFFVPNTGHQRFDHLPLLIDLLVPYAPQTKITSGRTTCFEGRV
ncbi:hypothetical protein [Amycolatopsis sp. Hca4]|uniref:hypothetical protein n=1 Tax=Amycolatopsis sp. Hca4 TaxID=2742131 RepID=UPI00158FEBBE|nr:hypothetical protein [Amycolatopsis sp. Hca4]QKV74177.1 hypothetical protein HUT10_10675 [Amycolatopsis sp. Hca4]